MVIGIDTDEFLAQGISAVTLTTYRILMMVDPLKDGSVVETMRLSTFQELNIGGWKPTADVTEIGTVASFGPVHMSTTVEFHFNGFVVFGLVQS